MLPSRPNTTVQSRLDPIREPGWVLTSMAMVPGSGTILRGKKKNSDQLGHLYHPQRSLSILIKGPLCCALPYIALVPNSNFPQAAPHPRSEPSPLR